MAKAHLFRWHKRTQLDIPWRNGWVSIGLDRRLLAYRSTDATPLRRNGARGWGIE